MRYGDVTIPPLLESALNRGELVIFVGAGASMSPPSGLPSFGALAERIAKEAGATGPRRDARSGTWEPLDAYLGRLDDTHADLDVHAAVTRILSDPDSRPNALHVAIAELASAAPSVRIVTTNYDEHLSTALRERDVEHEVFAAPALPEGDEFEGVVHLHGRTSLQPQRLVLTDGDFGSAYIRSGWASRFLDRMFSRFTVLFVGYSLTDTVMRYLARSLPSPPPHRYALLPDGGDGHATRLLNIKPLYYPPKGQDHSALSGAVAKWAADRSMSLLEHERRVLDLLVDPPSADSEADHYLAAVIDDPDRVRAFTDHARGIDWIDWIHAKPTFVDALKTTEPAHRVHRVLLRWFAEHYVVDPRLSREARRVALAAGERLRRPLWDAIGQAIHIIDSDDRGTWLHPWQLLMIRDDPLDAGDWLEYQLAECQLPRDTAVALTLLEHLLTPDAGSHGLARRASHHWVAQAYREIFKPQITSLADDLLNIGVRTLTRDWLLDDATPDWQGSTSARRSAIEPHEQDQHPDLIDVAVDMTRDAAETISEGDEAARWTLANRWISGEIPLLRRLAVNLVASAPSSTADRAVSWILNHKLLEDLDLHHEVMQLLKVTVTAAGQDTLDRLIEGILSHTLDGDEPEVLDYRRFSLLSWVSDHGGASDSLNEAIQALRAKDNQRKQRTHPDLLSYMTTGWAGSAPSPCSVDELAQRVAADADDALAWLTSFPENTWDNSEPNRASAMRVLGELAAQRPQAVLGLMEATNDPAIISTTLRGISKASIGHQTAQQILDLADAREAVRSSHAFADMLAHGGDDSYAWYSHQGVERILSRTWLTTGAADSASESLDTYTTAINRPTGHIATALTRTAIHQYNESDEAWDGLPTVLADLAESMLSAADWRATLAASVFAAHLHIYYRLDTKWTVEHLLPTLDPSSNPAAPSVWNGYLYRGRWSDDLLDEGLFDFYITIGDHLDRDEDIEQLQRHVAAIALLADLDGTELLQTVTAHDDVDRRTSQLASIAPILDELDTDSVADAWARVLRPYWTSRLSGRPRTLAAPEASAMVGWCAYLGDDFPESVELALQSPAGFGRHDVALVHFANSQAAESFPEESIRLITHLLRNTAPPFWGRRYIEQVLERVGDETRDDLVLELTDAAYRLGIRFTDP